jgi:hypothetical protein
MENDPNKMRTLHGYHATNNGNFLRTFRNKLSLPLSYVGNPEEFRLLSPEDVAVTLSRNVGNKLSPLAA